jgi:hypothetical protein
LTFRQEIIAISNEGGISRIDQYSGDGLIFLDDLLLAPLMPNNNP